MYASQPPLSAPAQAPWYSTRLLLRPYLPTDAEAFYQVLDAGRTRLQAAFPARLGAVRTAPEATRLLATFHTDWQSARLYVFGIWHQETQQYLGDISIRPNWTEPVTGEIGYYLAAEAQGHGYAREALAAILPFGFEVLQVERLLIRCRPDNRRSCAVAEAAGFQLLPPRPRPWPARALSQPDILYYSLRRPSEPLPA